MEVRSLQQVPLRDTWSAKFHRDGHRHIAIGTKTGNVLIWDTKNKSIVKSFPTPPQQSPVIFVSYNVKNTSLAATMQNGETVIYGLVSNIPVLTVKSAASKSISAMKFHHESRSLLGLATDEGHLFIRDITTNKDKVFFENVHASPVSDFTFSKINKDVMLSSGYDKIMHVYDIRLQSVVSTIRTSYTLTSIAINACNHVALGTKHGSILVYDLRDMTTPIRVLKGHIEEVKRVAFQPPKKKSVTTESSIRDEFEVQIPVQKLHSPIKNSRNSDMFFINDTPPKFNMDKTPHSDSKADSFLVMMGLDKTADFDDDVNKSDLLMDKKHNSSEFQHHTIDSEKLMSKVSTPLTSKPTDDYILPSPICTINVSNAPQINSTGSNTKCQSISCNVDTKTVEELKDFVKISLADVVDGNRDYFLNIMMALTKQKLYLEKQLASMSDQMQTLVQNQNALVETNRKLALEIDKLKMAQQYPL